jgi:MFS family permease
MYSDSDLEAAVAAGALSPEAAASLRSYVAGRSASPAVDEEHFRLITGFNDIFVSVAAAILLFALAWIGSSFGLRIEDDGPSPISGLLVAGAAWGLAEFFTRKRRMALPSILLLLAFVGGIFEAAGITLALIVGPDSVEHNKTLAALLGAGAAALAAGGAWLHWRRFKVPITIAAGAAAVVGLVMALIVSALGDRPNMDDIMLGFLLLFGVGVFLFAMWWDSSDPTRETRRSDVAFWLHLLSAPMIVHPVFKLLGLADGGGSVTGAVVVLLVYFVFGLAALAVDRRALLVSALAYVLWALSRLFQQAGADELNLALTALVIGSALLLLSAFWHSARRAVVKPLPPALQAKLPVVDRVAVTPAAAA